MFTFFINSMPKSRTKVGNYKKITTQKKYQLVKSVQTKKKSLKKVNIIVELDFQRVSHQLLHRKNHTFSIQEKKIQKLRFHQ